MTKKEPLITAEQIKAFNYEQYLIDLEVVDAKKHGRTSNRKDIDLSDEDKKIYTFISSILQMNARPDDPAEPYGPMFVIDGRRSMIPSDIEYEQAIELTKAASSFSNAGIRARIADIAWIGNRKDRTVAELAIHSYIEAVQQVHAGKAKHKFDEEPKLGRRSVDLLKRAFQISRAIKGKNQHPQELTETLQSVIDHAASEKRPDLYFCAMRLAHDYGIGDMEAHPEQVENAASWDGVDHHWAKDLLELAAISYRSLNKTNEENRCWLALAEKSVEISQGGDGSSMFQVSWLMTAIEEVRRARGPEAKKRAEELRKQLREVQEDVHFEMGVHTYELDLTDMVESNLAHVKNISWGEILGQFACLTTSSDPEKLREEAEKVLTEHPISSIFPSQKMDREGKVVSKRAGMSDETKDDAVMDQMAQSEAHKRQIMVSGSLKPIRALIQSETTIIADDFMVICNNSAFVPEGYEDIFALGFARFFHGDMISASSILMPMLENSLRHVLKTGGRDTSKIESDMTQEDSALSRLLDKEGEHLEAIFGKAIMFEIDFLFNSRYGPRIRHEQAHGKLATGYCFSDDVIYACWFLYRLTCLPLFRHWKEIAGHIDKIAEGRSRMKNEAELTQQQAADLLTVSRTHLVQLLDEEKIPYRKVGTHRRVRAEDVLAYRRETERARRKALDELTELDEGLGFQ